MSRTTVRRDRCGYGRCALGEERREGAADGFPSVPLSKVGRYVWKWARSHWVGVAESWRVHCLASRGAKGREEVEGVEEFNCDTGPRGWDGSGELTTSARSGSVGGDA
jgi:hypothetical protein